MILSRVAGLQTEFNVVVNAVERAAAGLDRCRVILLDLDLAPSAQDGSYQAGGQVGTVLATVQKARREYNLDLVSAGGIT